MTREEAIEYAESKKMRLEALVYNDDCKYGNYAMYSGELSFVNAALAALRPVSREQVEKLKTSVLDVNIDDPECEYGHCVACGAYVIAEDNFCSACGAPMTDKAVDMVMERLEAMKDGNSVKR